ncbi:zinc-binding dehydrogenase [Rhodococcus sp. 14C212]|uniref:zinc-binding dehydrogenase n=1 Tax=Rhodococcus sp. 14C212 TaxID=2711209 RepID=UPI0013E9A244|nr:zinc-binding dehydrogenase [Rhodococcus sp. 14C212]NGP06599.1 zinc-binding dehydrogenase [Rhodococcus sp. 14C212]
MTTNLEVPRTARAAVVTAFNEPLEVREVAVPELEAGAVLVRIDAATVCGSDVHLWDGSLSAIRPLELPIIPGHEMAGTVVALGPDGTTDVVGAPLVPGDRIVFTQGRCGSCYHCTVANQPNLCPNRSNYGVNCERFPYLVGGFADYCYVYPTSRKIKIPANVKSEWASASSCALRTVIKAFDQLGPLQSWQTVVIQGAGPLGLFATAVASHLGATRVIVIGDPADRLELARAWGATDTISVSGHPDPEARVEAIKELTEGAGAEVVMEFSGARTAFGEGLAMTRRGGRFLVAGQVGPHTVEFEPTAITRGNINVIGSFSASEAEYWRALQFMSATQDKFDFDRMLSNRFGLEKVTDALRGMQGLTEIKPVILPNGSGIAGLDG